VRSVCALATAILACALLPSTSPAATAKLEVALIPEHLGAGTTISFGFQITAPDGQLPPPVTELNLLYPANLGLATSGVGLEACIAPELQQLGPEGCPTNSIMGYGTARVAAAFEPLIYENVNITILSAPVQNGHLALLFYAEGNSPIAAEIVFPGLILPAPTPYGGRVQTLLPAFESVPGGPRITVIQLHTTLGPLNLSYYEEAHGEPTLYTPKGILLPKTCPKGGFPFAAELTFLDGTHTTARTTVPCPAHHRHDRPLRAPAPRWRG
jgi:hypothetical protein